MTLVARYPLLDLSGVIARSLVATTLFFAAPGAACSADTLTLSIGRPASGEDIARWDIDIGPDGAGLPNGNGTARGGEAIYVDKCAACHGIDGKLGRDKLAGEDKYRTVGNHWPYATTLFDYIRRAMPSPEPGSLSDDEVYALTAYVLYLNDIVAIDDDVTRDTLPDIDMPARKHFVPDNRRGGPEVR
ncbi:MAG: c-type cytochrome [Gammaproteobacteria bacterium]